MSQKGPFVYTRVHTLDGKAKVFGGECAGLVQWHTHAGKAIRWREGIRVRGNGHLIEAGTAVATFENGRYPNRTTGNHAALYLSQDLEGVWVMDQWSTKGAIGKRRMPFMGKNPDGSWVDPSNNGDALSVIVIE